MSHSRKHVKEQFKSQIELQNGHSIIKVIDLRGGNTIEVQYPSGHCHLAMIPSKFNKIVWIKKGNYAIIDQIEDQSNISSGIQACVVNILNKDNIKDFQKSNQWPKEFETIDLKPKLQDLIQNDDDNDNDDYLNDLPTNQNRKKYQVRHDESESDDDDDDDDEDDSENDDNVE
ncbi:hypothetical protein DLAC_05314 [Tieghemostelium lacteum]|uniref:S1-like domain-containing protein n=1 Tax=Tieghemostelium lacteum TaxID=361077 RepID=A0A151ZJ38_TIELA|nr:hypothetical protein DLAC_05314 [Tieghemostelium lacteum]|eukprot:KYQ93909.1 hypothetical protein DLAC_05314 [Tieghemostelium lacteum]